MSKEVICQDLQGNEYKVDTEQLSFRPAVYAIIIEKGKVLLSKQWDGYDFPGGGIELGETIEEALIREVKEETGLLAEPIKLIDCRDSFFSTPNQKKLVHSILIYYLCKITGGKLSIEFLDEEEKGSLDMPEWIELDTVNNVKFYSTIDCLEILDKAKELV